MQLMIGATIFMAVCIALGYLIGYRIGRQTTASEVRELLRYLTPDQADACPACFGDCERLHNDGLMHRCEVCGGTGKRR